MNTNDMQGNNFRIPQSSSTNTSTNNSNNTNNTSSLPSTSSNATSIPKIHISLQQKIPKKPRPPSSLISPVPAPVKPSFNAVLDPNVPIPRIASKSISSSHNYSTSNPSIHKNSATTTTSTTNNISFDKSHPRIQIVNEQPLIIRVNTKDVPLHRTSNSNSSSIRASQRPRKRKTYIDELQDTDEEEDDNLLVDTDDDDSENNNIMDNGNIGKKAKRKIVKKMKSSRIISKQEKEIMSSSSNPQSRQQEGAKSKYAEKDSDDDTEFLDDDIEMNSLDAAVAGTTAGPMDPNQLESPPPGTLPSLWYSRECFSHVWVIDKIIGWKTRPIVTLEYHDLDGNNTTTNNTTHPTDSVVKDHANHDDNSTSNSHNDQTLPKDANMTSTETITAADTDAVDGKNQIGLPSTSTTTDHKLDITRSIALSDKLINALITNRRKCMEISRINTEKCPVVMKEFALKEEQDRNNKLHKKKTFCTLKVGPEKEEVLLIKWRGRSHIHCSWERKRDLERLDITNTAQGKIKRYYQSQMSLLGRDWKHILEEGRKSASSSALHHGLPPTNKTTEIEADGGGVIITTNETNQANHQQEDLTEQEDFFAPDCVDVERILGCDESEMNMDIFARQRALNLKVDQDENNRRQHDLLKPTELTDRAPITVDDDHWDPEDNVRYVVKFKGSQLSDITWEYWRHIKHDSVDQAEDFWLRQKPPDFDELKSISDKGHPHMREYKKLSESPAFGISSVKRFVSDLDGVSNVKSSEDDDGTDGLRLRGYQLEGVNWLLWNWWNKRSCILADEMGLGKTIQSMCFLDRLYHLQTTKVRGPFLIVAPLSLISQWQSESSTWSPDMNVLVYHGSLDARNYLVEQEFYYNDPFVSKTVATKLKRQHVTKFNILITTYEVAMKDIVVLSKIKWKALIVDEAHRLKNHQSRLFSELAAVPRDYCLLLTGTPLQNSTEELWSLLNFSDPVAFAGKEDFVSKFGQLSDAKQVSDLHTVLRPYLLRRVKEDVEKSLPPKEETILEVTLTPIQKAYYKAIYEKNTAFLFKGSKPSNAPSLMNVMMELRKCCNHPFLIKGAEERIMTDSLSKIDPNDNQDPIIRWQKHLTEQLIQSSGKMVLLMKLLPKLQSGGHKVLIFSQMVRVLDLLEELLRLKKYSYERLDGSTGASLRAAAVDRFTKKSYQRFVMLLSTRAGGLGLNLTSADTVIIFDSDWNPQNDLQAMARAHRIGQTRAVRVYRLLTAKTYEMHMFHSASMKLGLDRAVLAHQRQQGEDEQDPLKSKNKTKSDKELQAKEIDALLKKGAYDVFRDDDDGEAQKFMETDIDQLLERSSRTVTYGNTDSSMNSGLGSFSKASFVTSDADGKDIDLDDPDFWEKAVGLNAPIENGLDENLMLFGEKRSRKQVQQFDPYASFHEAEQKKKDKIAIKVQQEKEEKKRLKEEKRKKEEQNKKKSSQEGDREVKSKSPKPAESSLLKAKYFDEESVRDKKLKRDLIEIKTQRVEQRRIARAVAQINPIEERIKQAWEESQRNKAVNAINMFGFGRFCKIRHEASLTSVPIQDIEIFTRAYMYQLGLQASMFFLQDLGQSCDFPSTNDDQFVLNAMNTSLSYYKMSQNQKQDVRIPLTLTETKFIEYLHSGSAIASLKCIAFLSRLNHIMECVLNETLEDLGQEELGRRGCTTKDLSTLDLDLKARHVTSEELTYAINSYLNVGWKMKRLSERIPAPWWDSECDTGLLIGTFLYGLFNYKDMVNDESLPFHHKLHSQKYASVINDSSRNFAFIVKSTQRWYNNAVSNRTQENNSDKLSHEVRGDEEKNVGEALDIPPNESNDNSSSNIVSIDDALTVTDFLKNARLNLCRVLSSQVNESIKHENEFPESKLINHRLSDLLNLVENIDINKCKISNSSLKPLLRVNESSPEGNQIESINSIFKTYLDKLRLETRGRFTFDNIYFTGEPTDYSTYHVGPVFDQIVTEFPFIITRYGLAMSFYSSENSILKALEYQKAQSKHLDSDDKSKIIDMEMTMRIQPKNEFIAQIYNIDDFPDSFNSDVSKRVGLMTSLLIYGSPSNSNVEVAIPDEILNALNYSSTFEYFNLPQLCHTASQMSGSSFSLSYDEFSKYMNNVMIPHCNRVCLFCHDAFTVESKLKDTSTNLRLRTSQSFVTNLSLIPDPQIPLTKHSVEAVSNAYALVRRLRMSATIRAIMEDKLISSHELMNLLRSPKLQSMSTDVPPWWCPWIHDLALLVHAAKYGLFSIIQDRLNQDTLVSKEPNSVFAISMIESHIQKMMKQAIENPEENKSLIEPRILPRRVIQKAKPEDVEAFIDAQKIRFPSFFVIEKRMSLICGEVSKSYANKRKDTTMGILGPLEETIFVSLPMFDHDILM